MDNKVADENGFLLGPYTWRQLKDKPEFADLNRRKARVQCELGRLVRVLERRSFRRVVAWYIHAMEGELL